LLLGAHSAGLCSSPGVLAAEQVEKAVNQKNVQFMFQRMALLSRLFPGFLQGDDYVSEHRVLRVGEFAFTLGKGQNIGGPVFPPPGSVQALDLAVVHEQDAYLRRANSQAV